MQCVSEIEGGVWVGGGCVWGVAKQGTNKV